MRGNFADLPPYLQLYLKKLYTRKNFDYEEYVNKKIPDLDNKSVIEVLNEAGGGERMIEFYNDRAGDLGAPYLLKKPESNNA